MLATCPSKSLKHSAPRDHRKSTRTLSLKHDIFKMDDSELEQVWF